MIENFWESKSPHEAIFSTLAGLQASIDARNTRWRRFLSIYNNRTCTGFKPGEQNDAEEAKRVLRGDGILEKRLALNPSENCISTLAARIASQRPRAQFCVSTSGPDAWSNQQRAKGMEKAVAGEWYRGRFYQKSVKVFCHAGAIGFGAMHVYPGHDRVMFEVAAPWEFIVDEQCAMDGNTYSLMREKYIPVERVLARFAGSHLSPNLRKANEEAIKGSVLAAGSATNGYRLTIDMVRVVEAWHLSSGWGADDGRHVVCIDKRTLTPEDEWKWTWDRFPFAFFPWEEPLIGWYPQGLVEREEPLQGQVNKLLSRIQEAAQLYSVANTYYEEGSINPKHLKNTSGSLIPYKKGSSPPKVDMPPSISSEIYKFIFDLKGWIFEDTGVSQLSAASVKPAGIESGRGLMVLKDSEGGRHAIRNQTWDGFNMDAAELTVLSEKELHARNPGHKVNYLSRGKIEAINWGEVDLDRDAYEIQIFPSSMLPHEPAGRIQQVDNLINSGYITVQQGKVLLNMPDLEQFFSLENAAYEDIEHQVEQILVDGEEDILPQEHQDLELGIKVMTSALLRAGTQGAPKERIERLMEWIERADEIMQAQSAPPPGMPPGGPGGPPPGPEMPPQQPGGMPPMQG